MVVAIEATGAQLKDGLEAAVASDLTTVGRGYPRVDGFTFDVDLDASDGQRVSNLRTDAGEPIDPNSTYTLAITKYVTGGGDQVDAFVDAPVVGDDEVTDAQVFTEFVSTHGVLPVEGAGEPEAGETEVPQASETGQPTASAGARETSTAGAGAGAGESGGPADAGATGSSSTAGSALPRTGVTVGLSVSFGVLLLVIGAAIMVIARRSRV